MAGRFSTAALRGNKLAPLANGRRFFPAMLDAMGSIGHSLACRKRMHDGVRTSAVVLPIPISVMRLIFCRGYSAGSLKTVYLGGGKAVGDFPCHLPFGMISTRRASSLRFRGMDILSVPVLTG